VLGARSRREQRPDPVVCALHSTGAVAALFARWTNVPYGVVLAALGAIVLAGVIAPLICVRTPYATAQFAPVVQPVAFDHRHHVRDDGIDCLYCHPGAETSAVAGVPTTELCMGCHGQVWPDSPQLAPVRASWESGVAIGWRRVHDLPDHVYFHHGVHVRAGIDCARCHGRVELMARVERVAPLTMGWCLDCHRSPPGLSDPNLRDPGRRITRITTCSACHR
jgi:hypothetical protein